MRIVLIHQYFKTPAEGGGIRSYYIAKYLKQLGHEVHVITAYNNESAHFKNIDGINIHYLPVYYTNHLSFWSRVHAFARFVLMSRRVLKKLQPIDFNYVITTPLTTGIIGLYVKWRFKNPYIFEVGDMWPDAPIELGVLKNQLLKRAAFWLEKKSYQGADKLVALSPDIKEYIQTKVKSKDIEVVTNMADVDFFKRNPKDASLIAKYGVEGKFVITYAGTVGMANHLEYLLDIAYAVKEDSRFHFIIAGDGARLRSIKEKGNQQNLTNLSFISFTDKEGVKEVLNISDAIYVSFTNVPVLSSGSPNKFFDGIAAGKLVIINFKGWIKELIVKHSCGFYCDPIKPGDFKRLIMPYLEDENHLEMAQQNSRILAENYFSKEKQLGKLREFLNL
ncbi:glycosyltransferase family 4 protein [Fulvivirga ligni]|uniref:glycosyltransferase family 4 protein n=1 Tax=Fulvivirga ligni TaxID=2904246 RepID=UPI001F3C5F2F|nr:glycosyltransferase family 4 protein [Fulvivirga ligni]UII22146.1 glycosyltransferase family 4 protein [Fulvivirga ligni]